MSEDRPNIQLHILLTGAINFALDVNDSLMLRSAIEGDYDELLNRIHYWNSRVVDEIGNAHRQSYNDEGSDFDRRLAFAAIQIWGERDRKAEALQRMWSVVSLGPGFPDSSVTIYSLIDEEQAELDALKQ